MSKKNIGIGIVKLVQIQPNGLIVKKDEESIYDVSRRVEVEKIIITSKGIEAKFPNGENLLDIHHLDHPNKKYDSKDLISIGFTSHYKAMRGKFGDHLEDGSAGENIIIEFDQELWSEDLGKKIEIEDQISGKRIVLNLVEFSKPCREFSHFANQNHTGTLPADRLKDTLQFLNNGRRGFLFVLSDNEVSGIVKSGDRVFIV